MTVPDDGTRQFATAYLQFLDWVHRTGSGDSGSGQVVRLVREHLGVDWADRSVVTRTLPVLDHVNLQLPLDAWSARPGREVAVHGIGLPPSYGGVTLQQLLSGEGMPPLRLGAPELVDLPSGPGRSTACLQTALLLVADAPGRYAVMVRGRQPHEEPTLTVEVAGLEVGAAQQVFDDLARLRSELNVLRGQVLELTPSRTGGVQVGFADLPLTTREDVVLPEAVLRRVERHTVDVSTHRDQLLAAGQLEKVPLREVWAHEAHDLTPWLLANAGVLSDALGMDLDLHAAEHAVGGFSLDLIGRDRASGDVVIVENQLETSDHTHLGQILTYAGGTHATNIVWVAPRFRAEHRAGLEWLNERTDENTRFFAVQVDVVRIGDSLPAPLMTLVVRPNDWEKTVKATTTSAAAR